MNRILGHFWIICSPNRSSLVPCLLVFYILPVFISSSRSLAYSPAANLSLYISRLGFSSFWSFRDRLSWRYSSHEILSLSDYDLTCVLRSRIFPNKLQHSLGHKMNNSWLCFFHNHVLILCDHDHDHHSRWTFTCLEESRRWRLPTHPRYSGFGISQDGSLTCGLYREGLYIVFIRQT